MSEIDVEHILHWIRTSVIRRHDGQPKLKGQRGKVAVVGGSLEYTGAPFFAAISTVAASCDLIFVYCHPAAAIPIKSYSPDLIVIPLWDQDKPFSDDTLTAICRADCVIAGPGAGQSPEMQNVLLRVMEETQKRRIPLVVDADGLRLPVEELQKSLAGHPAAILTPNGTELEKLERALKDKVSGDQVSKGQASGEEASEKQPQKKTIVENVFSLGPYPKNASAPIERAAAVGRLFNALVLVKGPIDAAVLGDTAILVGHKGSRHRCGGQGDVLSGVCGAMCALEAASLKYRGEQMGEPHGDQKRADVVKIALPKAELPAQLLLASIAAYFVRVSAACAEKKIDGYLRATDVINFLGPQIRKALKEA